MRPRLVAGGLADAAPDPRVEAVMEVLAGTPAAEVARRWSLDTAVLTRWVRAFVDAGTAQVTQTPDPEGARQRDRFLAAFAHELRTPLAVAQGWADLLQDGDVPPSQVAVTVGRLCEALARVTERTRDVEMLAAASLGRLPLYRQRISVDGLVAGVPALASVGVTGGELEVDVDPYLFGLVLRDLQQSAQLPPEPRAVRLEATVEGPWIELSVVREGEPIDPAALQALFEPFDTNDDATGVTIGLYLARALTVAHGGTVGVTQDQEGAAFWVRLPNGTHPTEIKEDP